MLIQKFTSGCRTRNGKYNIFTIYYKGILSVEITDKKFSITSFGIRLWEVTLSDISMIKIHPEALGVRVDIMSRDGNGFLFFVDDSMRLLDNLKKFNLPMQYDEKAIKSEAKRSKLATNPIIFGVLVVFLILIIFVFLLLPV